MTKALFQKRFTKRMAFLPVPAVFALTLGAAMILMGAFCLTPARAGDIVEEWATVKPPKAPELKAVTVDPKTTALVICDIQNYNCDEKKRPRCIACLPKMQNLLKKARAKGMTVVYTLIPRDEFSAKDIRNEVAPLPGELVVKGEVDKFMGNDMEKYLKDKGIKTVIVVGTSANGAVLHTVVGASLRKFQVVLPVDGMPDTTQYAEQRMDMIQF